MRIWWLLVLGVAACSPYSFPKEVAAISSGVDKLSDSFASGYDNLAADRAAKLRIDMIDTRARVLVAPSCGLTTVGRTTPPCRFYLAGTNPPQITEVERTRATAMAAVRVLKDYANGLAAVTNAADRAAYDAAVAQLSTSVGALTAPANATAPGTSVLASASVNLFGWLVGTALDQQRYDSLRKAVTKVGTPPPPTPDEPEPVAPIRVVTRTLGKGLELLKAARYEAVAAQVNALVDGLNTRRFSEEDYKKRLADAQAALDVLDGLRKSEPAGAAEDLANAHDMLLLAIQDPTRNHAALLKAIGDFVQKISAVNAALGALTKKGG